MPTIKVETRGTRDVVLPEPGHWERTHEMTDFPPSNMHWVCDDGRVFNGWFGTLEPNYIPTGVVHSKQDDIRDWERYRQESECYLGQLNTGMKTDDINGGRWWRYKGDPRDLAMSLLRRDMAIAEKALAELKGTKT